MEEIEGEGDRSVLLTLSGKILWMIRFWWVMGPAEVYGGPPCYTLIIPLVIFKLSLICVISNKIVC